MDFGDVIKGFKEEYVLGLGEDNVKKFARKGWNGKGMWIAVCLPCGSMTVDDAQYGMQPFIVMKTAQGTLVPWLASQTDMLADDWEAVQ